MNPYVIAPIVEGYGDVQAIPALLRRMLAESQGIQVLSGMRAGRSKILNDDSLTKYLRIAEAAIVERGGRGGVLVVFDADESCAAELGPRRQEFAASVLPHRICRAVVPVREFETWIIGGMPGIEAEDSDTLGAAKARLKHLRGRYSETADQARLIHETDLALLQARSRSFRRLSKVVGEFDGEARASAL